MSHSLDISSWLEALVNRVRNWRIRRKEAPVWYYIYRSYRMQEYRYKITCENRARRFFECLKYVSDYMDLTEVRPEGRKVLDAYADTGVSQVIVN